MCCGVRMRASSGSAAPPPGQASGTSATSQKHFEALWKLMITRAGAVLEVKGWYTRYWAKSFVTVAMWWCRVGTRDLGANEPVLARILTPPQHTVKFFCHFHRLPYYVVMLRYFFRTLFSSLCCAVIGFVASIFHEVLFDTFCFWACNSPYFILIFLLP